ncbi:myogenesis-regulating glycosidase-like [Diadema antillarum]|uniref:myogenesis-regulating glycosidase-like n=1 Tax=Diadema antillarum TaxID=105358 RepID=UPI003A895B14
MPSGRTVMLITGVTIGTAGIIAGVICGVYLSNPSEEEPSVLPVGSEGGIEIRHGDEVVLMGRAGVLLDGTAEECSPTRENGVQCLQWGSGARLEIAQEEFEENGVTCNRFVWQVLQEEGSDRVLQDCYEIGDEQWFGSATRFFQHWPINEWNEPMTMYVSGDMYARYNDYGSVLERYWLSSKGVAIRVSHSTPLHASVNYDNDGLICFKADYTETYYPKPASNSVPLDYTICSAENIRVVHDYMTARYVSKPEGLPDVRMMRSPIWSTWARYKTTVNQSIVLNFADEILANGFNNSQIEIDDGYNWPNYGDYEFNESKFPNATAMVEELHEMGFRVTLWVTPFANERGTKAFAEGDNLRYWVKEENGQTALISWWAGTQAAMLDVTNPDAVDWFVQRLEDVRTTYGIDSFKFDAGETNYLGSYKTLQAIVNPCEYTTGWVNLASRLGTQVEVRVGFETQRQPIFVRMMDKDSIWGWNNGLKTLITSALTFSVLGYPYVLADMIGGNVYEGGFRNTYLPDKELFIRWLQITAFMPAMQYSISPWQYVNDTEVVNISRYWTEFHENVITPKLLQLAEEETLTEGKPMIRPLWWIAPTERDALLSEDEFLVGDDLLVAPIVEEGALSRRVYLPKGRWRDELHGTEHDGGDWLQKVEVPLSEALYYTRVTDST